MFSFGFNRRQPADGSTILNGEVVYGFDHEEGFFRDPFTGKMMVRDSGDFIYRVNKFRHATNKSGCLLVESDVGGGLYIPIRKNLPQLLQNTTFENLDHIQTVGDAVLSVSDGELIVEQGAEYDPKPYAYEEVAVTVGETYSIVGGCRATEDDSTDAKIEVRDADDNLVRDFFPNRETYHQMHARTFVAPTDTIRVCYRVYASQSGNSVAFAGPTLCHITDADPRYLVVFNANTNEAEQIELTDRVEYVVRKRSYEGTWISLRTPLTDDELEWLTADPNRMISWPLGDEEMPTGRVWDDADICTPAISSTATADYYAFNLDGTTRPGWRC